MEKKVPRNLEENMSFELQSTYSTTHCNSSEYALSYDKACLNVYSFVSYPVTIKFKSDECSQCSFVPWAVVLEGNSSLSLSTTYQNEYMYVLNNISCCLRFPFVDNGVYALNITEGECNDVLTVLKPRNFYLPLLIAFIIAVLGGFLWKILLCAWYSEIFFNWCQGNELRSELENDLGNATMPDNTGISYSRELQTARRKILTRVKALDTFRGLSIALMIFVNYGGGKYWFFEHSPWNGLTVADLVFPWFAWIMGISISVSLRSQLRNSTTRKKLFYRVLRRSLCLFILGLVLNTLGGYRNGLQEIRIFGVLQRLGLSYFIVASMETFLMKPQGMVIDGIFMHTREVLECWKQWLIVMIMVACHTCLTFLVIVPDCPTGYLGPGGLHNQGKFVNCTGGAAGYIDRIILGEKHMYQHPTSMDVYKSTMPFDPEGILGTLTTVFLVFLGVQAGRILMTYTGSITRILRLLIWSMLTGLAAGFLCNFSKERGIIPVNKNLWSLSFVLSTASMAFVIKALLFFTIDVKKWWNGGPLVYAGMNPLLLYVGHVIVKGMFPWFWKPFYNSHSELLAMNIWGTALWIMISYCLYQYNVFFSL